jgi:hypothetical protein
MLYSSLQRVPVHRTVLRDKSRAPIKVWDAAQTATEAEPPASKGKVLQDNLATA